ncbi:hypothetical protein O6H91_07G095700 [Diphasiastrum complanatum]|uniref:Uncharacterized protein n=1 Tax=Diphasiastrum complanatum TaxID=34168 RepID=A0ACC2D808_DIPCM|nr:hypothetical protein O6H91_07G095700 [Diphasiastrum complanatum]
MRSTTAITNSLNALPKEELVPAVKAALLRIVSQEVAYLLGNQLHEEALPLAMDAVQQGQALFYPSSTPQLVPLYLMAIQANLGLGRATQSEDLLGLAVWLLLQDTKSAHNGMRAELGRLFGQLYMLQGNFQTALKAFSEEVYYSAIERGIFDTHTSLGFFHLCEVFKKLGKVEDSLACGDIVIQTWLSVLQASVFTQPVSQMNSFELSDHTTLNVPMRSRLFENLHPKEIVHMLQAILTQRAELFGGLHACVAEASFVLGLTYLHNNEHEMALTTLEHASALYKDKDPKMFDLVEKAMQMVPEHIQVG